MPVDANQWGVGSGEFFAGLPRKGKAAPLGNGRADSGCCRRSGRL